MHYSTANAAIDSVMAYLLATRRLSLNRLNLIRRDLYETEVVVTLAMRLPSYGLVLKLNTGTNDQIIWSELRMNQSTGTKFTYCLYCHVDCLI